jgi:ABC-type transporter Mla subunit MlaD
VEAVTGRTDFFVGLFILITIGVVVGAAVLTSGLLEGRYELHMRAAEAEGLTQDTHVELQGLEIGRVGSVAPQLDTATNMLHFVATLSIRERFPDGTHLRLPRGTRALIAPPATLVGAAVIELQMPPASPATAFLQPGDTIDSERRANVMETLSEIAAGMHEDVLDMLTETRELLAQTTHAVRQTNVLLASARPQIDEVFTRLNGSLDRTDRILAEVEPHVGPMADTIMATLVHTRGVLAGLDSLTSTAHGVALDSREKLADALDDLARSAEILEHFSEQISRRPMRMLWGVTPPPDSAESADSGDEGQ